MEGWRNGCIGRYIDRLIFVAEHRRSFAKQIRGIWRDECVSGSVAAEEGREGQGARDKQWRRKRKNEGAMGSNVEERENKEV